MTASSDSLGSESELAPRAAEMLSRSSLEEGGKEAEGGGWSSDAAAFAAVVAASLRLWREDETEAEAEAEWEGEGV